MGLFGAANGIDGDLRPGLPGQMIEVHDPVRLLMVVEHFPQVVLETIRKNPATYEWFENEWVVLMVVNPESGELHFFRNGKLQPYMPEPFALDIISEVSEVLETATENLPVLVLNN